MTREQASFALGRAVGYLSREPKETYPTSIIADLANLARWLEAQPPGSSPGPAPDRWDSEENQG